MDKITSFMLGWDKNEVILIIGINSLLQMLKIRYFEYLISLNM